MVQFLEEPAVVNWSLDDDQGSDISYDSDVTYASDAGYESDEGFLDTGEILPYLIKKGCEDVSLQLDRLSVGHNPVARKNQAYRIDIYQGRLKTGKQLVSISAGHTKLATSRFVRRHKLRTLREVANKLSAWSKWKHTNILGLIGVTEHLGRLAIVSPWTDYLNIQDFLLSHPQADRYALCTQIAYGVVYLHSKGIVHGYIAGSNINVTQDHIPKIAGFEFDPSPSQHDAHPTVGLGPFARWLAPEIMLKSDTSVPNTLEADVYSLAMTIFETITGAVPYDGLRTIAVLLKIAQEEHGHPERPVVHMPYENDRANKAWSLLVECWAYDPKSRPTSLESVDEVLSHLYEHGCKDATRLIDQSKYTIYPVTHGGFGDVYNGRLNDGSEIALKCLRLALDPSDASQKQVRNAAHELYVWSKCNHPNVLPLIGVTQHRNQLAMVSPWMKHGSLGRFLSRYPEVDRYDLCAQIADGIAYLHGEDIVHGDIKGANILVSKDHTPKIADFGTATLREYTLKFTASATASKPGISLRWTAPEILGEVTGNSFEGDVYALGMTMLEIITGEVPYFETPNENALVLKVAKYELPKRPEDEMPLDDEKANLLWSLLNDCWSRDPMDRPTAIKVRDTTRAISMERFR